MFFSNAFAVCPGCSQHASGTAACLCALRFASTHALTYVTLIIIWSFPNNNYTKKYGFLTVCISMPSQTTRLRVEVIVLFTSVSLTINPFEHVK